MCYFATRFLVLFFVIITQFSLKVLSFDRACLLVTTKVHNKNLLSFAIEIILPANTRE